jgi:pimeloyl-ACP methyl ester carboxylesterase
VQSFTGWTDDQLRDVRLPVLILVGDTDFIHVENAAEAMRLLPQGQLAVLPGTTHMDLTRSTLLAPVIEAFLA